MIQRESGQQFNGACGESAEALALRTFRFHFMSAQAHWRGPEHVAYEKQQYKRAIQALGDIDKIGKKKD